MQFDRNTQAEAKLKADFWRKEETDCGEWHEYNVFYKWYKGTSGNKMYLHHTVRALLF